MNENVKEIPVLRRTRFSKKFNFLVSDQDCQGGKPEKCNPNYIKKEEVNQSLAGHLKNQ